MIAIKNLIIGLLCFPVIFIAACEQKKLPFIGESDVVKKIVDGKEMEETVYPSIPDFSFQNQNGEIITEKSFSGKIYVADFFFTTCPTICPIMKKNMLKVYQAYKENPDIGILSHSIDPEHDSVAVLNKYAKDLGITGSMWHFVTGDREKIYEIGQKHYLISARKDPNESGGYIHSGHFVLIDKNKHIRGMYDGTTEEGTKQLIEDIAVLLEE